MLNAKDEYTQFRCNRRGVLDVIPHPSAFGFGGVSHEEPHISGLHKLVGVGEHGLGRRQLDIGFCIKLATRDSQRNILGLQHFQMLV